MPSGRMCWGISRICCWRRRGIRRCFTISTTGNPWRPDSFDVGPSRRGAETLNGVPNSIIPNGLQRLAHGLNENYGREVMELHTLGVKGGYTQADVIAVARCFTGWTVRSPEHPEFVFAPFMHDFGEKTVLGHKIPAGWRRRGRPQGASTFWRTIPRPRISFRLAWRAISWRTIPRRRWWTAWRRLS